MFGLLNQSTVSDSLKQEHYSANRGRFYLFWNCLATSGVPMLIALMAGNSATSTEVMPEEILVNEITNKLQKIYPAFKVPQPSEVIVTRWKTDPMAKGSYSYVAPETVPGDYDLMAKAVGPIHFAGEATCGTHPATVHGAYLSGLRAASEVLQNMIGNINISEPLIETNVPDEIGSQMNTSSQVSKLNNEQKKTNPTKEEAREAAITAVIEQKLGQRPTKPVRTAANPYLLFQKDHWFRCKAQCDEERQKATMNPEAKASRNAIRAALGNMWRCAAEEVKEPYLHRAKNMKENIASDISDFKEKLEAWENEAARLRADVLEHQLSAVIT